MSEQEQELIRTLFWIAFVWNDHNFERGPEERAREVCAKHGVTNLASANAFLEALEGEE